MTNPTPLLADLMAGNFPEPTAASDAWDVVLLASKAERAARKEMEYITSHIAFDRARIAELTDTQPRRADAFRRELESDLTDMAVWVEHHRDAAHALALAELAYAAAKDA